MLLQAYNFYLRNIIVMFHIQREILKQNIYLGIQINYRIPFDNLWTIITTSEDTLIAWNESLINFIILLTAHLPS
jgi:hypothetical protein